MSSSVMGRDAHSLMLSLQHYLCRPRRRPSSKVPRRMVLERLSWRETCPNHVSFLSLDSCQKRLQWTNMEVDLAPHPVVGLVLQVEDAEKFPQSLGFETLDRFSESASRVHVPQLKRRMRA